MVRHGVVELAPEERVETDVERLETEGGWAGEVAELLPEDRYEEWIVEHRDRLAGLRAAALRREGRWAELLRADPTDEEITRALMRERAGVGDRAAAVQQFRRLREALASATQRMPATCVRILKHRVDQPSLPDPDVAEDQQRAPAAACRRLQRPPGSSKLAVPADHRRPRPRRGVAVRRTGRSSRRSTPWSRLAPTCWSPSTSPRGTSWRCSVPPPRPATPARRGTSNAITCSPLSGSSSTPRRARVVRSWRWRICMPPARRRFSWLTTCPAPLARSRCWSSSRRAKARLVRSWRACAPACASSAPASRSSWRQRERLDQVLGPTVLPCRPGQPLRVHRDLEPAQKPDIQASHRPDHVR